MKAYYFDNAEGDQRLPHIDECLPSVDLNMLKKIHVNYWFIPIDDDGNWEKAIDQVAQERSYKNRDVINVSKAGMGDAYDSKIKGFYQEHLHEDEEIRYILYGAGYFDIREASSDVWIRIRLEQGDLLVLPPGIYHRFTLDEGNYIKAMRLFKEEPQWIPHNRSAATEANPYRIAYLESVGQVPISV